MSAGRLLLLVSALTALAACATEPRPTPRSATQVAAFKRANPCPSTGRPAGRCPGYVVDHVAPLACGGPDTPANMQWQTTAEAKTKDRWERKDCRPRRHTT